MKMNKNASYKLKLSLKYTHFQYVFPCAEIQTSVARLAINELNGFSKFIPCFHLKTNVRF